MQAWIMEHEPVFSLLISLATLAVWVFYAQLLLSTIRRQRQPSVQINRGKGNDMDAEILVSNMSQEAVFVQCLIAVVETNEAEYTEPVTDVEAHDENDPAGKTHRVTAMGPLASGSYMRLGRFRDLGDWISPRSVPQHLWVALEIRVVFLYGSDDHPIAAYRRFSFRDSDTGRTVTPDSIDTRRMTARRHRRKIRDWLESSM